MTDPARRPDSDLPPTAESSGVVRIRSLASQMGENIGVRRFVRVGIGEGLEGGEDAEG